MRRRVVEGVCGACRGGVVVGGSGRCVAGKVWW